MDDGEEMIVVLGLGLSVGIFYFDFMWLVWWIMIVGK